MTAPLIPDGTSVVPSQGTAGNAAPFVLVPGAWHGEWCWRRLAPLLRLPGYDVYTPTLTGLGDRAHLLSPRIDLDTHVQDVLGAIEYEDLQPVVLVGSNYGGVIGDADIDAWEGEIERVKGFRFDGTSP